MTPSPMHPDPGNIIDGGRGHVKITRNGPQGQRRCAFFCDVLPGRILDGLLEIGDLLLERVGPS